ncbi:hypothetical protein M422DRAFT_83827, partial [Sphaerobolus stellatus SS14]
ALRIEWCRARARSLRWSEQMEKVMEEMRCVMDFFQRRADWWIERLKERDDDDIDIKVKAGVRAYALQQANILLRLRSNCVEKW